MMVFFKKYNLLFFLINIFWKVMINIMTFFNDYIYIYNLGFENSNVACCGQGRYNGMGLCTPLSSLCDNRDKYVFWDAFHPTERANRFIVEQMMKGTDDYMRPMNLTTIMHLDSYI